MQNISLEKLNELRNSYLKDDKARIVRNALKENDISKISRVFESDIENPNVFSIDLKTLPVTNQKHSGRCWIFSAMNVMRNSIAKRFNMDSFELSQNYVAFYDKLEKCNWFMECVLSSLQDDLDDKYLRYLLDNAVSDGGQWDMVVSLVKKYGICPKTAMPETYQSSNTYKMNELLNTRLRRFVCEIEKLDNRQNEELIKKYKQECLKECYWLIADCFGVPPQTFAFEYRDKDNQFHAEYDLTPKMFYESYLKEDLDEYVTIINAPTADKEYYGTYTVKYLGNVVGGNEIKYLNLPMDEFQKAIILQMKDEMPVWFGCDCSKFGDREKGLWDDKQFDYENTLGMHLDMTKEEMLDYRVSQMNHAMVLDGVNLVDGKPNRWKIENSWGDKIANEGFFICSNSWFEKYVYEASVKKCYLNEEALAALKKESIVLEPWDPFGSLAD